MSPGRDRGKARRLPWDDDADRGFVYGSGLVRVEGLEG
jgi:hypothetical protein